MGRLILILLAVIVGSMLVLSVISGLFDLVDLVWRVVVWMLAGMIAGRLLRGKGYGPLYDILLGVGGGLLGGFLLRLIGLNAINNIPIVGGLVVGVIGAVLLVWIVRVLGGNRRFAG